MRDGELTYAQQIEMMGHLNAWKARALAAEARAEAAERRAGELEGALRPFAKAWDQVGEEDRIRRAWLVTVRVTSDAIRRARALLPATQAEGEK